MNNNEVPRNVTMNVMEIPTLTRNGSRSQFSPNAVNEIINREVLHTLKKLEAKSEVDKKMQQGLGSCSERGRKYVCAVCDKGFPSNALVNLHTQIHYFESTYKCEACAISFRTNEHLKKHKRSLSHVVKTTIGEASNPRPYYCGDCKTAFRFNGHLVRHFKSKCHIKKLENLQKWND